MASKTSTPSRPTAHERQPRRRPVSAKEGDRSIRLQSISVNNYKAIDSLDLELPAPAFPGEQDVFVFGSRNGLGKTSLLEASAILILGASGEFAGPGGAPERRIGRRFFPFDIFDAMVRAGSKYARISGILDIEGEGHEVSVTISREKGIAAEVSESTTKALARNGPHGARRWHLDPELILERLFRPLLAIEADPLVLEPVLYFHSYRKVREGDPELGAMVDPHRGLGRGRYGSEGQWSLLKVEILRALIGGEGRFEGFDETEAREHTATLNQLLERFAGGHVEKLRALPDNTIEFRITPHDGGPSFSFDGLSSGQKEIVSTLFLIWRYTKDRPCVVLVDEPELHLNPEWHATFVRTVFDLAPANQYIIATHSEDVFGSVAEDRRRLLEPARG
jgi:hypothetical protein